MSSRKSTKVLCAAFVLFVVFGLLGAPPVLAATAFVTANGPYEGNVGEEIVFDANDSTISDGSPIEAYYWDWDGDGQWDESFTTPEAPHTWYSAYSGLVRVYVFFDGGVDWAETQVTIAGDETALAFTAGSSTGLHLRAAGGGSMGVNDSTGLFDLGLAGATMTLVPPTNAVGELDEDAPVSTWNTLFTVPLTNGPEYTATLIGNQTGPFELRVQGLQDGRAVSDAFLVGEINQGETVQVDVSVSYIDGNLQVQTGQLMYHSEMEVDPNDVIELGVQPGGRYSTTITIREMEGLRPLSDVALTCTELVGETFTIPVSNVSFTPNGFDVAAGGDQAVVMTVDVPASFLGQATGTVTVETAGGHSEEINLTVHKAGRYPPVVEVVSPVSGIVGEPVQFDAGGSYDPDGGIESFCWDWDLTGQYECYDGPDGWFPQHTWNRTFSGLVHLRVTDTDGFVTERYVQVVVTEPEEE